MTRDVNQERLERLKGDLAELRARAVATSRSEQPSAAPPASSADGGSAPDGRTQSSDPDPAVDVPRSFSARPSARARRARRLEVDREPRAASRSAQRSATPPADLLGRPRAPRPPRRNPLRRRAQRPPGRVAVPTPVPVPRRSRYLAAPRWPQVGFGSGAVILLVALPVVAQLVFRLWTAMEQTSVLLGADPTRIDSLRAAAGVAGGGLTATAAVAALGIVRGRVGYLAGAASVLLLFVVFPYLAYTSTAGIVAAPLPTLQQMITPEGWGRAGLLRGAFLLSVGALVLAIGDLVQRSVAAVQRGMAQDRR